MDWADKAQEILGDIDLHEEFQRTTRYEYEFITWYQEKHPEEWGND